MIEIERQQTIEQFKGQHERVLRLVEWWHEALDLKWCRVKVLFSESTMGTEGKDIRVTAVCDASWQYREAKITFYLPSVLGASDERLEEVVVHELCHIITDPIAQHVEWEHALDIEFTTETVCRSILAAYRAGVAAAAE